MALTSNYLQNPATISGTAETVVISSFPASPASGAAATVGGGYAGLAVRGFANVTLGTADTSYVWRVRSGTTTAGATIGSPGTVTTVALTTVNIPFFVVDTEPVPTSQYSLTVTLPSAGAGAVIQVNQAEIETDLT